jgi:hypothetical protein
MGISFAFAYKRQRQTEPELPLIAVLGTSAFSALEPFWHLTMIALGTMVLCGVFIFAIPNWFPVLPDNWSTWMDSNSRALTSSVMATCLIAPVAIHAFRTVRPWKDGLRPRFGEACWAVYAFFVLPLSGLAFVMVLVAAGLKSWG